MSPAKLQERVKSIRAGYIALMGARAEIRKKNTSCILPGPDMANTKTLLDYIDHLEAELEKYKGFFKQQMEDLKCEQEDCYQNRSDYCQEHAEELG